MEIVLYTILYQIYDRRNIIFRRRKNYDGTCGLININQNN